MHLLASWVTLSFGLWITSALVPGFKIQGFTSALAVGAIFGILHFLIGWLLFTMIGLGTLFIGFVFAFVTWWIVSAIVLKMTAAFTDKLSIDTFGTALIASGVLSLLSAARTFFLH